MGLGGVCGYGVEYPADVQGSRDADAEPVLRPADLPKDLADPGAAAEQADDVLLLAVALLSAVAALAGGLLGEGVAAALDASRVWVLAVSVVATRLLCSY